MKSRKQRTYRKKIQSRKQKGGDNILNRHQHYHLKKTLARLGPTFHNIRDVWCYANSTVTKIEQVISNPELILQYVYSKVILPHNNMWFLVNNELVKYIPIPGSIANTVGRENPIIPNAGNE